MSNYNSERGEKDVGITLFLGSNPKFTAVIKQRYSDFHVNEIDPQGNIVHLTSLDVPIDNRIRTAINDPEVAGFIPESVRAEVASLHDRLMKKAPTEKIRASVDIKVTDLDKESRTKIHRWVSSFDKLSSETVDKDGDKFIKVVPLTANIRLNRRPENRAKYTHCVMYKEGVETSDAIGIIAKKLNLKPGLISYAGIKDKRAKTTQRIAISNIEASRLVSVSKYTRGVKLGNFEYKPRPISLGELKGNHFKLLLKDFEAESDEFVNKAVNSLKTLGFINYFGMQRFGSYAVSTYEVGKKVLQHNWLQAFDMILMPKPNDQDFMIEAKKLWSSDRNADAAMKVIPRSHRSIESHLLFGLARFYPSSEFVNAFQRIPRNIRLLYIHAYQSYIWNRVASYRVQEYGVKPVVGDLVYADPEQADGFLADALNIDEVGALEEEAAILPGTTQYQKLDVKLLSEDDIEEGKYSIYDVLIPLHGTEIKHPSNKTKDYLEQLLKDEGIDGDCFLKYRPVTDAPKGAYRKLLTLPTNVSHKIINYSESDPVDSFIPSDWDILQNSLNNSSATKDTDSSEPVVSKSTEIEESALDLQTIKEKKCISIEFSLPASAYATMALRELIDEDKTYKNQVGQQGIKHKAEDETEVDKSGGKKLRLE